MALNESHAVITDEFAERVMDHLNDEEQSLVAVLDAVRGLHESLRELDGDALAQALETEAEALKEAEHLQQQRHQFRDVAASQLKTAPQEITLGLLAQKTSGPLQASVLQSRQRLTELSVEMDRLNRQNAAMIQQSLMLMRGIVGRLTRTTASGESYGAGGVRTEAHVGSIVQWGG